MHKEIHGSLFFIYTHKSVVINVVWPSKYSSLSSFQDLIDSTLFIPFTGTEMSAVLVQGKCDAGFPLRTCEACLKRFSDSQLFPKIEAVQWGLVGTSSYDLKVEVVN